jgi:hypothetical protein
MFLLLLFFAPKKRMNKELFFIPETFFSQMAEQRDTIRRLIIVTTPAYDDWELLSEVSNGGMGDVNCKTYSYTIAAPSYYMYFRLEISSCVSGSTMQLSEFSLSTINPDEDE